MNVVTQSELSSADGAPLLRTGGGEQDEEFLIAQFALVELHATVASGEPLPLNETAGTLFVTTRRVVWIGDRTAARVGYGWDTSSITLHAISRDPSSFPRPCLYCQVDAEDISELRFVPSDPAQLQALFEAFSKSAELNPDDDDDDETGDDGWIFNEDEVADGARAAEIAARLDAMLMLSPALEAGQFDDADEDGSEDDDHLL